MNTGTTINDVRDYWDRQPCGILHSPMPDETIEYYAQLSERRYFVQPHIKRFAEFDRWAGKKVLEIGCGLGTDAEEFAKAGAIYTGMDLSPSSVALAMRRFNLRGLTGSFVVGNAEHLDAYLTPQRYDLIYSFGVLHHTPQIWLALEQIRQYMHAESELRIMLYAENSWKAAMIDAGLDQSEAQAGCPIAHRYTKDEVYELLEDYEVISVEQDHIFPYQIEPYKQFRYVRQPWFEAMPPEMFRALEKKLGWHMLIRAIGNQWINFTNT